MAKDNQEENNYMTHEEFFNYMKDTQGYTKEELKELDEWMEESHGEFWNNVPVDNIEPIKLTRWQKFLIWIGLKKHPHQIVEVEEDEADLLEIEAGEYVLSPRKLELKRQRAEMRLERRIERQKIREERKKAGFSDLVPKSGKKLNQKQVMMLVAVGVIGIVAYSLYKKSKRR